MCADDINRIGWPLQFYEEGGFAYRSNFNGWSLLIDITLGVLFSIVLGRIVSRNKMTHPR